MTVLRHEFEIEVRLVSPFITRGMVIDRALIDAPLAKNAQGHEILPATLVKGVLRAALVRLERAQPALETEIAQLFGSISQRNQAATRDGWRVANEPDRGCLLLDDLVIDDTGLTRLDRNHGAYARIEIDKDLGAVREGHLQFVELPFAIGTPVAFKGRAELRGSAIAPARAREMLQKALALVPAIGAIKSAGFGRVAGFDVGPPKAIATRPHGAAAMALDLTYCIDRPFLVGGQMRTANLSVGDRVIPGSAIKGTLAETLRGAGLMDPDIERFLAGLVIGHAFPKPRGHTGCAWQPPPLSLALADDKLVDRLMVDVEECGDLNGELRRFDFAPDIKNDQPLRDHLGQGWELPGYNVRTRTKIDPVRGSAAYENGAGQLFSLAAVEAHNHFWQGRMVARQECDRQRLEQVLGVLQCGATGFGKTNARLCLEGATPLTPPPIGQPPHALTLQTSALLNDPDQLRQGRSLFDDYAAYWAERGYRLLRFFASQRLDGGYLALRYPPHPGRIEPWLLTEPGSIFLLQPENAAEDLATLILNGLPLPGWLAGRTWQDCPFLPQNGFGQIRLDAVDHHALAQGVAVAREKAA